MRINTNNTAKIAAALDKVQRGYHARCLTPDMVKDAATAASEHLVQLLPCKYWRGFVVEYDPWCVPGAYKYGAEGTIISMTRGATSWFVTGIWRGPVATRPHGLKPNELRFSVPQDVLDAAIPALLRRWNIEQIGGQA